MLDDIDKILITEKQIRQRVAELGEQIAADYRENNLFAMSVLKGSVVFLADITRAIKLPLEFGFVSISTYQGTTSSKVDPYIQDAHLPPLAGKDILLVEDILDTGKTIKFAREWIRKKKPHSMKTCIFLAKGDYKNCLYPDPDYIGFEIPPLFVVGYGLDYQERYRNLPFIGVLKEEVYAPKDQPPNLLSTSDG